jgi:tetratricopeptide (TPR) repeat protein
MHLLHFDGDRLVRTDFSGKTVPPYAILSHRWDKNQQGEVLFNDVGYDKWKTKRGRRKIDFCAKQAALDRLQYFWIDTCCIDRWNRHERSKAINSMFRWYRDAAKCYVFLEDVSVADNADTGTWEASFRKSEWFTRGWTLQELIAPTTVQFFSAEGLQLGDKSSLKQIIKEVTGLPIEILEGWPVENFSDNERMSWADQRETTEPEDSAYCLLGILNISMPFNYNEGKGNAMNRLRVELKASKDHPCIIPFSRNERFVGRETELAEVEAMLFAGLSTTRIAITGEGGTGKSQLALQIAHRTKQGNKNCSVFWIDASSVDSLRQAYLDIAEKLKLPGWAEEKTDIVRLVSAHLSGTKAGQWLLVFDNVDDIALVSTGLSAAQPVNLTYRLPQSELGSIIFTTTNESAAKVLSSSNVIALGQMRPDAAQEMLRNHLVRTDMVTSQEMEVQHLLRELSYLPLAIVLAAAYININKVTVDDYRSQLTRRKEKATEASSDLSEGVSPALDAASPVTAALLLSVEQLLGEDKQHGWSFAAYCLFLAACVERTDIPLDLFRAASTGGVEEAISILHNYALVTRRPADDAIDLHRLVYNAIQRWLLEQKHLGRMNGEAIERLAEIFPDNNHESRSKWRRLLPHARYALSYGIDGEQARARINLMWKCAMALHSDGQHREAEPFSRRTLAGCEKVLGKEHPDTLISMSNLALVLDRQGKYADAEEMNRRTLATSEKVLGKEHPDTLTSMSNLALVLDRQGKYADAEEMNRRTLATSEKVLGKEHPDTLISMSNLAGMLDRQGKYADAEEIHRRTLATREKVLGKDHPDTLMSMYCLAHLLSKHDKHDEAKSLYKRTSAGLSAVLGNNHPTTQACLEHYAQMLRVPGSGDPSTLYGTAQSSISSSKRPRPSERNGQAGKKSRLS